MDPKRIVASIDLPYGAFDAVVAFYAIGHVPRDRHPELLRRIRRWLRPDGLLLVSEEDADRPDVVGEWLGAPMFFSGHVALQRSRCRRAATARRGGRVRRRARPRRDAARGGRRRPVLVDPGTKARVIEVGKASDWLREERRKTLGDWVAVCVACGYAQRYFDESEHELPDACPQCAGELRSRCLACGARFSSAFAVDCEACGGALRAPEQFGIAIRKKR